MACGIFHVYDGHPLKFLSISFYSDPLKKVVLSIVGAFSKNVVVQHFWHGFFPLQITQPLSMPEILYVQHLWQAITTHTNTLEELALVDII